MDKNDLRTFRKDLEEILQSIGDFCIEALPEEEAARQNARRSLVCQRDIPKGHVFTPEDLTWKRPAHGISPRFYDDILGRRARIDLKEDTVLTWSHID